MARRELRLSTGDGMETEGARRPLVLSQYDLVHFVSPLYRVRGVDDVGGSRGNERGIKGGVGLGRRLRAPRFHGFLLAPAPPPRIAGIRRGGPGEAGRARCGQPQTGVHVRVPERPGRRRLARGGPGGRELEDDPGDFERLFDLLNVEANFDPKFDIPYLLGGLVLGESPDHAKKALEVFERGKREYPADWRFPFYIGYTNYFSLGETEAAGKAMAEAARLPGSPAYLPGLASRMLSEAREPGVALAMLETIVRQESDPSRRAVLERRIREVTVERDLLALERAVESYREKMGAVPRALSDLVRAGILTGIPEEPNGGRYLMEPGGKVRSDRVSQRLRVFQSR